ncbi:MAG: hypothetical protein SFX73_14710 [Kofleriaceae bacterium]|nr:hypothetical protein [Kofleriaceae bacterium]
MNRKPASTPLVFALLLAACPSPEDDDGADLDETTILTTAKRSAELFSQTAALAIIAIDPLAEGVTDAADAAAKTAGAASSYFDEPGCIAAAVDPSTATATLTFDDCDGPFGFADVNGEVLLAFTRVGAGLSMTLASNGDLEVDAASVRFDFTVTIPDLADPRTVVVSTSSRLSLSDGFTLGHDGEFTLALDESLCFTLAGELATVAAARTFTTTIDDFRRCAGGCPDGGVTMTVGTRSLAVLFDGDASAEIIVTSPDATSTIPLPLLCF